MILEKLEDSFSDEYNKLVAYTNELKLSNPGSDVIINLSKDALEEGIRRFLRMYICFQAMKFGFKNGLRPFIGLDGTFLKGKAKGQLLVVVGQDSANHFYLLAWAIIDKETKLTWKWFLGHMQTLLDLKMGKGITFISDMQKGLIDSIQTVLPESHFRFYSVDKNLTESFNAWILQARHKPIIKMLEDIRIKVMNMINEHEAEVMTWGNEYSPKTMELYNQFMRIALKCHINGNADNGHEVT
ncbi:uncharacterized protein [Nicotiana tomentosiformis]|uniref:uncharacterized protein n=1 Tax=Nicotiana tomentosiformis TaxID=4098 RepID=UPI00051B97D4|nr:uncharacterized protein LOC117276051 [Nicotiana tomentosiformis]